MMFKLLAAASAALVISPLTPVSKAEATPGVGAEPTPSAATAAPEAPPAVVAPEDREEVLGSGWRRSSDRMWTTSGDASGFHVLVAEKSTGYAWRTAATLSEPALETDRWIGNACATASGTRVVVVYAPRAFTNQEVLSNRGGFTAIVNLETGVVDKLDVRTSLAYFNPGCGAGEQATLTQEGDADLGRTRILVLDASTGRTAAPVEVPGQLTSPIPTKDGLMGADAQALVAVDKQGRRKVVAKTAGVPSELTTDAKGAVVYMDQAGGKARALRTVVTGSGSAKRATTRALADGKAGTFRVNRAAAAGKVFITGTPDAVGALPPTTARLDVPTDATISTQGEAAVTSVQRADGADPRAAAGDPSIPVPVTIEAQTVATEKEMAFTVDPGEALSPRDTDDPGAYCAVPRNDPEVQVYQPKPKQVEWAVNMAVRGNLTITRPADWHNNNLGAYQIQGGSNPLFPLLPLTNAPNGRVPIQVMLGVFGQESNLWQASPHALPGEYGNPLVGNYYGNNEEVGSEGWTINWSKSDCGYGVSQTTDGMRKAAHSRNGEIALSPTKQKAVATDYAANVASGLRILQDKWNQTQAAGLKANNNDPLRIENWYFALWAYNSGYHQPGEPNTNGAYGLGWGNNPANPRYRAERPLFGLDPHDFAKPQEWAYQEKVIGFAANPPSVPENPTTEVPLFRPAWWNGPENRAAAAPHASALCDPLNDCVDNAKFVPNYPGDGSPFSNVIGEPAGPCAHKAVTGQYDLKCWWHSPLDWKQGNCDTKCGFEFVRYDYPQYAAEQADGESYPPVCGTAGLPSGFRLIDDLSTSVAPVRVSTCTRPANAGTFNLTFGGNASGETSKIDLHQIGGGYGAHYWFGHTQNNQSHMKITGTWTFAQPVRQWARVYVHLPAHSVHTRQARYDIDLGNGEKRFRVQPQRIQENRWVTLGSFPFDGIPKITLSNQTADGESADEGIGWDAVGILPLASKPKQIITALGDSFSSGEGASEVDGKRYDKESNVAGDYGRDGCHRSLYAWPRQMWLSDTTFPIRQRMDTMTPDIDFKMVACSGAQTHNLLATETKDGKIVTNAFGRGPEPGYGEIPQLDSGWVDKDTTLVTLSVGGNDSRFTKVVTKCAMTSTCQEETLDGDSAPMQVAEPELIRTKVMASVQLVLEQIHRKAPNAKVLLMGYPAMFQGKSFVGVGDWGVISAAEAAWLDEMAAVLNNSMESAAIRANVANIPNGAYVTFADPRAAFAGKGINGDPQVLHDIVLTKTTSDNAAISAQSFHPKVEGAMIYATVASEKLKLMGF
jgi:hypothetical protein